MPRSPQVSALSSPVGVGEEEVEAGVEETAFVQALPQQAMNAYEDQCAPANPRMPMLADMQQLMRQAYYGNRS